MLRLSSLVYPSSILLETPSWLPTRFTWLTQNDSLTPTSQWMKTRSSWQRLRIRYPPMLAPSTAPKISITISPLQFMKAGEEGRIYQLRGSEAICNQLQQMGLAPGTYLQLIQRHPKWILLLSKGPLSLSPDLVSQIWVCMDPCCALPQLERLTQKRNLKLILSLGRDHLKCSPFTQLFGRDQAS